MSLIVQLLLLFFVLHINIIITVILFVYQFIFIPTGLLAIPQINTRFMKP